MTLRPANFDELRSALAKANAAGTRVATMDLAGMDALREHAPEDMTCTVEAGMTVAALQARLASAGQWLPIDPPNAERVTIGALLDQNLSGPRRLGFGTIREHLIGIGVVLADGRLIRAGGKVVKNVAGYDLCKVFVGARGTLGVIVEATFKLRPLPEVERFVGIKRASLEEAGSCIERVLDSPVTPVVLDWHGGSGVTAGMVLGFAGTHAEVDWQMARVAELGFTEPADLAHERAFWNGNESVRKASVAPSRLMEMIRELANSPFIARAGNGVVHWRGGVDQPRGEMPTELFRRLKDAYDPKRIFPEFSL